MALPYHILSRLYKNTIISSPNTAFSRPRLSLTILLFLLFPYTSLSIENNTCTFLTPNTSQLPLTYCECPLHSVYLQTTSFLMTISLLIHQNVPTPPPIPLVSPTINNRTLLSWLLLAVFLMNMILPLLQEHCHLPLLQFLLLFLPLQVILSLLTLIHTMAACCHHFLQATKAYIHFHLKMVS